MSQTYQKYLSGLNIESPREYNDWGQYYDMESQILINAFTPLKHSILKHSIVNQFKNLKKINSELDRSSEEDIESGLKQSLEIYTAKQSNNTHKFSCKCTFITSLIYVSHLVLFIMLFK
jgi:hypothetical protein